jgi:hypothetical protein
MLFGLKDTRTRRIRSKGMLPDLPPTIQSMLRSERLNARGAPNADGL